MREILYLQAGNFSNYIGTHFWNTQDAYSGSEIDDQISFIERLNPDGTTTLYPRAILFDWKDNFGTLAQDNALLGMNEPHASELATALWDQPVDEIRHSRVPTSRYHKRLEKNQLDDAQPSDLGEIRYWSDFSHVYYLPRAVQRVPRPNSWGAQVYEWNQSQDQFRRYNEENDLMDTSVRLFLEESDSIQGVQVLADVSSFGGFSDALLTQIEDEFMKTSTLAFPILSTGGPHEVDADDAQGTRRIINEAFYLRNLQEHATLSIPVSAPESWSEKAWMKSPTPKSPYFSSSIIAAHVESVTVSLRTSASQDRMNAYGARLSMSSCNPGFADISGVIPVDKDTNFGHCMANFTNPSLERDQERTLYSVCDFVRGFNPLECKNYTHWKSTTVGYLRPQTFSFAGYPLTAPLHTALSSDAQASHTAHMLSRLSTSNGLARLFKEYASFTAASLGRRTAGMMSMSLDVDEIHELVNDLWNIHDSFPADSYDKSEDTVGTDEE